MNRPRIASIGITLALAGAATAASATTVYREVYVSPEPAPMVRVERVAAPDVIYEERYVTYAAPERTRVVERYVEPRERIVVEAAPLAVPRAPLPAEWNPRHPHWGHLINYGLFNRQGPNDFGR